MIDNRSKDPIKVLHSELERYSDSAYKSKCPACKNGILLIYRNQDEYFRLRRQDHCISCGQQFIYMDETINGEPMAGDVDVNERSN
jgi:hypothetical protein